MIQNMRSLCGGAQLQGMLFGDRVDQSMKLSTVFVEGMYSNIRRDAIQKYIPLQKYFLQETLVNIIGDIREFFFLRAQYNYYSEKKQCQYYRHYITLEV